MKKIHIIKIGSDSVSRKNLEKIITDIEKRIFSKAKKVIIISSGAVKLGRERVKKIGKKSEHFSKSALASIGQQFLMQLYDTISGINQIIAEVLIDDFGEEKHLYNTLDNLLENNVLVVVNHNDSLHPNELNNLCTKSDNDKNSVFLSRIFSQFGREKYSIASVILLTNTDGLLDDHGNTLEGGIINSEKDRDYYKSFVKKEEKSSAGTGGMDSKLDACFESLMFGVENAYIANASKGLTCLSNNKMRTCFCNQLDKKTL